MECPSRSGNIQNILIDYCAGNLSVSEERPVLQHLASCGACREVLRQQQAVWSALDAWDSASVSPDFDSRVYARIRTGNSRRWYSRMFDGAWSFRPAMPIGAVCALLVALALFRPVPFVPAAPARAAAAKSVDMEQVERALDDIDMLKQAGVVPAPAFHKAGSPEAISL